MVDGDGDRLAGADVPGNRPGHEHGRDPETALTITSELARLPLDDDKRDDLLIFERKFLLKMAERMTYFCVMASFVSTELGKPWPIPDWAITMIASIYGGSLLGGIFENGELLKVIFNFVKKVFKRGPK